MKRVYISQLLCPAHHCIVAMSGEYDSMEAAAAAMEPALLKFPKYSDGRCEICNRVVQARVETIETGWNTMAEAKPHLHARQLRQLLYRHFVIQRRN
jgi:hypothetical protein